MTGLSVSVVIASRGRPGALLLALEGVAQQDHTDLEAVVVACPEGVAAVRASRFAAQVKLVAFDEANISAARNLGIALAAGEVVAFLDDDAVPEPTWAGRLAAPFADPQVTQAGGFVRGRNGISFQWRAMEVDAAGRDHPMVVPQDRTTLHRGDAARAVKTQGTNCAFRRTVLAAAGGFDPAFRFFLDEADVNLRLAARGGLTAVVPLAQVVHGYAASARRRADRVPTDLYEIGASVAAFLRRHATSDPAVDGPAVMAAFAQDQRRRLVRHMVSGGLEPRDVPRLMDRLAAGMVEGITGRPPTPLAPIAAPLAPFCPLPGTGPRDGVVVLSTPRRRRQAQAQARAARAAGAVVTLLHLVPGWRAHWSSLRPDGIWEQRGGLWGRAVRGVPAPRARHPADRLEIERARLAPLRPVGPAVATGSEGPASPGNAGRAW